MHAILDLHKVAQGGGDVVPTLKEYAERSHVTYEAVRQLVKTHAEALEGHISKQGRARVLDEEACAYLDSVRQQNPVVVMAASRDEELERLTAENKALMVQVMQLQDALLQERDKVAALQAAELARLQAPEKRGLFARLFGRKDG